MFSCYSYLTNCSPTTAALLLHLLWAGEEGQGRSGQVGLCPPLPGRDAQLGPGQGVPLGFSGPSTSSQGREGAQPWDPRLSPVSCLGQEGRLAGFPQGAESG
jgi:hypothetical protein